MTSTSPRRRRACALAATLTAGLIASAVSVGSPALAASTAPVDFHAYTTAADFGSGTLDGGAVIVDSGGGALTLDNGATTGSWTSPAYDAGFDFSELVSSWQADTPADSWVETDLSVEVNGQWSPWFVMGKWAFTEQSIKRTSVPGQDNDFGFVSIDTYFAHSGSSAQAYRLREQLNAPSGVAPTVRQVAATASDPQEPDYNVSATTMTHTVDLFVPQYSQETHRKEYPAYGGGGEAWCSPTSTEMVVEYWHEGPTPEQLQSMPYDKTFEKHGRQDPTVDWAALHTYDWNYDGTGNWPFNAAYASHYGLDGSVRQYDSLVGLEGWIKQGVPVVVSIAWNNKSKDPHMHLDGSDIDSTGGHLIVVRGFTADGDVIANDPASPTDSQVRHVYKRAQFEYLWLHASNGMVYLIKPYGIPG